MLYKFNLTFLRPVMSNIQKVANINGTQRLPLIKVVKNETKKTANVIMQRHPVNSFNLELLEELTSAIKDLEEKDYRGMILSSSCPTVFSAGLDLGELYNPDETRLRKFWKSLQDMWKLLYVTPLITIAAINGHAPAGGCLLAMSCDHSIMVKSGPTIGLPATKVGILVPKWLCEMYICALGFRRAEHALKLGEVFSAEEALKLNIVDELVDSKADLMPKAEEELDEFLKIPIASLQRTKLNLRQPYVDDLISYAEEEIEETVHVLLNAETQKTLGKYFNALKSSKSPI